MLKYNFIFWAFIIFEITKAQNSFLDTHFNSDFYKKQWVGFYLYDPVGKREFYNFQGEKYFIPASNTKIFSLYTGLKIIPDSIPALKYLIKNDTLYIAGTGDPSLLESYFKENKVINFLKNSKKPISLFLDNFKDDPNGKGWMWDDFAEYYSAERSAFPIYGNIVNIYQNLKSNPNYFERNIVRKGNKYSRLFNENIFFSNGEKHLEIPFITSDTLTRKLLEIEIKKPVTLTHKFPAGKVNILYSIPSDSLFKRMMLVSDNFLAEQILMISSGILYENMNSKKIINYMINEHLNKIPQKPIWVDGSGLSRYNNISPQDFVFVLNKMYQEFSFDRLINIFPTGGVSGTLKNSFKSKEPYIFAKTGSMGQVYNLSGYLKTKSNKILIFSYMNNNFQHSNGEIKMQIQKVLEYVRDTY